MSDSMDTDTWTRALAAWFPAPVAEEKAHRWLEVRHLFEGCIFRPPREGPRMVAKGWELRLVVPNDDELARVREGLRRLDVPAGRPFSKRGNIVLPVYGRQYAWLPALMDSCPPTGTSRPPSRPRAQAAAAVVPPSGPRSTGSSATRSPKRAEPAMALRVAETDTGFEPSVFRGRPVWAGPCHGCGERVVVDAEEGRPVEGCKTTALRLGPTDDPRETVILCVHCGHLARRWDWRTRDDPARASEVARLAAVRAGRVRDDTSPSDDDR